MTSIHQLDADSLVDHLWALLQHIRAVAQPRVIILSQRLWFPEYEELHDQTALVNHHLQILVEGKSSCAWHPTHGTAVYAISVWRMGTELAVLVRRG